MIDVNLYSLQEFLEKYSVNQVKKILKTFKCTLNKDIENFLHNKAITFEKKLRSRTYLLIDKKNFIVAGYFSIAISVLYANDIKEDILLKIGDLNSPKDIPCLLIGQIAKSDYFKEIKLGKILMKYAIEKLKLTNKIIGGRFILLDAINEEKIIKFYEEFGFFAIEKSNSESIKMIRPFY
jgi:predicted GNAT family N-acyltransferase